MFLRAHNVPYIYAHSYWRLFCEIVKQEPITQREGALNFCMYADSTCCRKALDHRSLYGKRYVSTIIHLALVGSHT